MKKNDIKQLATATKGELKARLEEALKSAETTRADVMLGKVKNVHSVREARKDVARILTVMKKVEE